MDDRATHRLRVQFIHGLEGSPQGSKARFLARRFETLTLQMNTGDFKDATRRQAEALERFEPDIVVGSSFGGAVALALLAQGRWRGPTLLLAPASRYAGGPARLPDGVRVLIVHGVRDEVVDIEQSRRLASTGSSDQVELIEVDDGHRLSTLVTTGRLSELVLRVAR